MSEKHLVVIRGNSGSGKSSIARALRLRAGRGWALVEQDNLRRVILREKDLPGGLAPAFIEHNVRFLLQNDYHVILEGILHASRYGAMLQRLRDEHDGPSRFYYLDVSFPETVRRHGTRPQFRDFTAEQMREWYAERDAIDGLGEQVIPESSAEAETLAVIASGLQLGEPH